MSKELNRIQIKPVYSLSSIGDKRTALITALEIYFNCLIGDIKR